jgi:hypothetical protein
MGIELTVQRDGEEDPVAVGLAQLNVYLDGLSPASGWLAPRLAQRPAGHRQTRHG